MPFLYNNVQQAKRKGKENMDKKRDAKGLVSLRLSNGVDCKNEMR